MSRFVLLLAICLVAIWVVRFFLPHVGKAIQQSEVVQPTAPDTSRIQMRGLTHVAPPEPFSENPIPAIKAVGANWIAVVPYAFTMQGRASVKYEVHGYQWWGERPVGVRETIKLAHQDSVQVMLKPQVYIPGAWTGLLQFETEADWQAWEADYRNYILLMAGIAEEMHVALFCIGTEFRASIATRPAFWHQLIREVRAVYSGKLTYSANWDDWQEVPFYAELDYIGMSAYHPLVDAETPALDSLVIAWQPIAQRIADFQKTLQKPVLFTECGYLSVDGAGGKNWELEQRINHLKINETAQARCYDALFTVFRNKPWWAGAFIWKWFPNMRGHEGYPERDYTPQGKEAEVVLKKHYGG